MKPSGKSPGRGAWAIFRWPLLLAVASGAGLVGALLTDAPLPDAFWTALTAAPLAIALVAWRRSV